MTKRYITIFSVFLLGGILWHIPHPEALTDRAWHLFIVFFMTLSCVILRPVPMSVTALTAIAVCTLSGIMPLSNALDSYSTPVVWLVFCAFLIARGLSVTGLGTRLAYFFMRLCGQSVVGMGYGFVLTDLVLAPAIPSNTARGAGLIFPVLQSLVAEFKNKFNTSMQHKKFGAYLATVSFHGNLVTSSMFLTAVAANPLSAALAQSADVDITWGIWALAASVPGVVCLAAVPLLLYTVHRPELPLGEDARVFAMQCLEDMGPMTRKEWIMAATFMGLLVLWVGGAFFSVSAAASAILGIVILLWTNVLTWEDVLSEHAAWNTFIWFGALLMLATELQKSGFVAWFGDQMLLAMQAFSWKQTFLVGAATYCLVQYFYAGITALVSSLYAIFLQVMIMTGVPPFLAAMMLCAQSSLVAGVTHYGTGSSPVFYGARYVSMAQWWRIGGGMALFYLTIFCFIGGAWWFFLGLWDWP